jgi:microcystin-dependent protein
VSGVESVTLLSTQIPSHNHLLNVSSATGTASDPTNAILAQANTGTPKEPAFVNAFATSATGTMAASAISLYGGNQPHTNIQPFLAVSFIIALSGIYPSRN